MGIWLFSSVFFFVVLLSYFVLYSNFVLDISFADDNFIMFKLKKKTDEDKSRSRRVVASRNVRERSVQGSGSSQRSDILRVPHPRSAIVEEVKKTSMTKPAIPISLFQYNSSSLSLKGSLGKGKGKAEVLKGKKGSSENPPREKGISIHEPSTGGKRVVEEEHEECRSSKRPHEAFVGHDPIL